MAAKLLPRIALVSDVSVPSGSAPSLKSSCPRPAFLPAELPPTPKAPKVSKPPQLALSQAPCPPPNFTGRWLLNRIDGDFEALLKDMGSSWCDRKKAKANKFGVGKWVQQVLHEEKSVTIESAECSKVTSMSFRIGSSTEIQAAGLDGRAVAVKAYWEGGVLQLKLQRHGWAKPLWLSRYLQDGELVVKAVMWNGDVVRRYYTKQVTASDRYTVESTTSPEDARARRPADAGVAAFSGKWTLERIDGDFEALLIDAGASWPLRRLAQSMNYGIGKATQDIQQDGDSFVILNEAGPKVTTMKFMVGAGEQQVTGQDGTPAIATPLWDGCVLQMTLKRFDGTKLPSVSRRLVGGQLVLESVSSKGETVRRYFNRRVVETAGSLSSNATASDVTGSTVSVTCADTVETSSTEELARTDFSGRWLLEEIEGDCELLLIDAGAHWALRKLAKGMKYGLGRATQDIRQEGDAFVVVSEGGPRVTTQNFRAGAGEQQVMMPDGSMVVGTPQWQDGRLLMAMKKLDGTRLASVDRSLVGGRMFLDSVTSKGELVRRAFVKQ